MHHEDDLVEHRIREVSFGAQCTNHSANSMCFFAKVNREVISRSELRQTATSVARNSFR